MSRDPVPLWDMLQAARQVVRLTRDDTLPSYASNLERRLAVERLLTIVGEAARRISPELRAAHPEIPWSAMVGLRNVLTHGYSQVDDERVWRIAVEDVPRLIAQIEPLVPPPPTD